jgi:hypothetical protein
MKIQLDVNVVVFFFLRLLCAPLLFMSFSNTRPLIKKNTVCVCEILRLDASSFYIFDNKQFSNKNKIKNVNYNSTEHNERERKIERER